MGQLRGNFGKDYFNELEKMLYLRWFWGVRKIEGEIREEFLLRGFIAVFCYLVPQECPTEVFLKEANLAKTLLGLVDLGGFEPPTY